MPNLLARLHTAARVLFARESRSAAPWSGPLGWEALAPAGTLTRAGVSVTPETALGLVAYYAAINVVATDVASLPLPVYRRRKSGGRDEARDDPRWDLLNLSPDDETTAMRSRQALLGLALGWGNGFWEIEPEQGRGLPLGLHLLDPRTRAARRVQDRVLYYRLPDGATLPPRRVVHVAGLGGDGLNGYSVARLHAEALGLGIAAQQFGSAYFGNGTTPKGALKTPNKLDDKAVRNLRESWNNMHRGPENAHSLAILEQGLEWVNFTVPPEEAQFIQTRGFQVIEVARMFRVPPHKLMDYSNSGSAYRALEESNLDYIATTLGPWCRSIEMELNRKLFTPDERAAGLHVEHDLTEFLRGDARARAEYYTKLRDLGALTPNEVREAEHLNPIGPDGDLHLVPAALVSLEEAGKPKPEPAPAPAGQAPKQGPAGAGAAKSARFAEANGHA
jgi:HK97 family phage portal protein